MQVPKTCFVASKCQTGRNESQATLCICHARYTVTTTTTADSDSDADSLAEIQLRRATATDTASVENKIQFRDRHGEYYKCVLDSRQKQINGHKER